MAKIMQSMLFLVLTVSIMTPVVQGSQAFKLVQQMRCKRITRIQRYAHYGCYCGIHKSSGPVKDSLDRCCKEHDDCFDRIDTTLWKLFYTYRSICSWGHNICLDSRGRSRNICNCDKNFASCIKRNERAYNPRYQFLIC